VAEVAAWACAVVDAHYGSLIVVRGWGSEGAGGGGGGGGVAAALRGLGALLADEVACAEACGEAARCLGETMAGSRERSSSAAASTADASVAAAAAAAADAAPSAEGGGSGDGPMMDYSLELLCV